MNKSLLVITLAISVLTSCHKNSGCTYPFAQEEIPELTTDGYNTCEAIVRNFTYRCNDFRDYPYWSCEGDTIKVCGYIHKKHFGIVNSPLPLYDGESDNHDLFIHYVSGQLPDTIDYTKKCYVEGILFFNIEYEMGKSPIVPKIYPIRAIHFE